MQWKHINFSTGEILIEQALDRFGNVKSTKGNKKTLFEAPTELMELLANWKVKQQEELKLFGLKQTQKQFVFTYNDRTNNINLPLHTDYLNYRMKSVRLNVALRRMGYTKDEIVYYSDRKSVV